MKKIINLLLVLLVSGSLNAMDQTKRVERGTRKLQQQQLQQAKQQQQLAKQEQLEQKRAKQLQQELAKLEREQRKTRQKRERLEQEQVKLQQQQEKVQQRLQGVIEAIEPSFLRRAAGAIFVKAPLAILNGVFVKIPTAAWNGTKWVVSHKIISSMILLSIWSAIEAESLDFYSLPEYVQDLLTQYSPEFLRNALNTITIAPETFASIYNDVINLIPDFLNN